MATQIYSIPFQATQYLFWTLTTQSSLSIQATLTDDSGAEYFSFSRQSTDPLNPTPVTGGSIINGNNLTLTVIIEQSTNISVAANSAFLSTPTGNTIGATWIAGFEDSSDNDFNDLYVSLIAWNSAG